MKTGNWYRINFICRMIFLFLAPTMFLYLAFAFLWHSMFWGAITIVVMVWGLLVLITPLFGRIGCGWLCPFGTIQDLAGPFAFYEIKSKRPVQWLRLLQLAAFAGSALAFYFIRVKSGAISGVTFAPFRLSIDFNRHYEYVWMFATTGTLFLSLALGRRGGCRLGCPMGGLCAIGSKHARMIPVVDTAACTSCGLCQRECPGKVPVTDYIRANGGLVTDSECLKCGRCLGVCKSQAISFKMVWNRKKFKSSLPSKGPSSARGRENGEV
jgi:ferredoxin-type protein NapH